MEPAPGRAAEPEIAVPALANGTAAPLTKTTAAEPEEAFLGYCFRYSICFVTWRCKNICRIFGAPACRVFPEHLSAAM